MLKLLTNFDMPALLSYMHRHYLETPTLLANVLAYGVENRSGDSWSGDYFGFFDGAELVGVAGVYNSASCLIHCSRASITDEYKGFLRKHNFKQLIGLQRTMEPILPMLKGRKQIRAIKKNDYMINQQFEPHIINQAEFLSFSELGEEYAVAVLEKAYSIAGPGGQNRLEIQKYFRERSKAHPYLFLKTEGEIKALAYVNTGLPNVAQIGGVYTQEDARGRGYCKAITSELCARVIDLGKIPVLSVSEDNIAAKRAYEHIGFRRFDSYIVVDC